MIGIEFDQEGGRRHHQDHMAVPAMPGAGLAMIETEIVLGSQKALLNGPAQPGRHGEFGQSGFGGGVGEVVGNGLRITAAPAGQYPTVKPVPS